MVARQQQRCVVKKTECSHTTHHMAAHFLVWARLLSHLMRTVPEHRWIESTFSNRLGHGLWNVPEHETVLDFGVKRARIQVWVPSVKPLLNLQHRVDLFLCCTRPLNRVQRVDFLLSSSPSSNYIYFLKAIEQNIGIFISFKMFLERNINLAIADVRGD